MATGIIPVYTHPDFYIFPKPESLSFHSESGTGFFHALQESYEQEQLYPVHRLDKCTSGLMVVARTRSAATEFGAMFSNGEIRKTYIALSDKKPLKKQGWIKGDMQRGRNGNWKLARTTTNPAVTRFFSFPLEAGFRGFILQPLTGKTHQLRVAMKAIGSPIYGDMRYGGTTADRTYLHAARIAFRWKNLEIDITAMPDTGSLFIGSSAAFSRLLAESA